LHNNCGIGYFFSGVLTIIGGFGERSFPVQRLIDVLI